MYELTSGHKPTHSIDCSARENATGEGRVNSCCNSEWLSHDIDNYCYFYNMSGPSMKAEIVRAPPARRDFHKETFDPASLRQ